MNLKSFDEAVACYHHQCYTACAIMIRLSIEEIADFFQAPGFNLHHRIMSLHTQLQIPIDLLDDLMSLKSLGNNADHIEIKTFNKVDKEELDAAIMLIEHILTTWVKGEQIREKLNRLKKPRLNPVKWAN